MTSKKFLVAFATLGWLVGLLCASYIFFPSMFAGTETPPLDAASNVLIDKPLTFSEVERSAFEKWKLQGFGDATKMAGPKKVAGRPGCDEYSYYLTKQFEVGAATGEIIICGKEVHIGDVVTREQLMKAIRGR